MMSAHYINLAIKLNSNETASSRFEDEAYVLHSRAYRNTSMIVDVYTKHHGRLSVLAKGAKQQRSDYYGTLQPFQKLYLQWGGRSELKTLFRAELLQKQMVLPGQAVYYGFYINELLVYLLHKHESHTALFDVYQQCLQTLANAMLSEVYLRYFELALLEELGYGLNLEVDYRSGELIKKDSVYLFHVERGVHELQHTPDKGELVVQGETLIALTARQLETEQQKREAKQLLRFIIEYYLEGKPIHTRKLLQSKKQFSLSNE